MYSLSDVVCNNIGHGVFALGWGGFIFSHSSIADNCKAKCSWRVKEGDTVEIEFNPETGILTFNKAGCPAFAMKTGATSSVWDSLVNRSTNDLYFCALLGYSDSDISIV